MMMNYRINESNKDRRDSNLQPCSDGSIRVNEDEVINELIQQRNYLSKFFKSIRKILIKNKKAKQCSIVK